MGYTLGVDLGTATCAAAVGDPATATSTVTVERCAVGETSAHMPAVALPMADGHVLVGEEADQRCAYEPALVARMVAGRVGDAEPVVVDGRPCDPSVLTGALLGAVLVRATHQRGGRPANLTLTYPLRGGDATERLLAEAGEGVSGIVPTLVPEPVAAVAARAYDGRLAAGATFAVVDVGATSSDVTLVHATSTTFDLVGDPASLPEVGGAELDAVVLDLVESAIGDVTSVVDPADRTGMLALRRLRTACRRAKERLSSRDAAVVEVALAHARGHVEITRAAFEHAAEPHLARIADLLASTIDGAGLVGADLAGALLTGGSAHIPRLAQRLTERTGVEVFVDDEPDLTVARGAALYDDPSWAGRWPAGLQPGVASASDAAPPPPSLPSRAGVATGEVPLLPVAGTTTGEQPWTAGEAAGGSDETAGGFGEPEGEPNVWEDGRTSVFDPAPPVASGPGADAPSPAEWGQTSDEEVRRLRTSDTDPFGSRGRALSQRLRQQGLVANDGSVDPGAGADEWADVWAGAAHARPGSGSVGPDEEPERGDEGLDWGDGNRDKPDMLLDPRILVGIVLVAALALLAGAYGLLRGDGSENAGLELADGAITTTTERSTTTSETTAPSTTAPSTTEAPTTTESPPRTTTTEPPDPQPPPPPPTPPPTPVPTTTTTRPPTTTTTQPTTTTTNCQTTTTTTTDCPPP
jgi:actin-like ATPase involved in cell morphogenesis